MSTEATDLGVPITATLQTKNISSENNLRSHHGREAWPVLTKEASTMGADSYYLHSPLHLTLPRKVKDRPALQQWETEKL